MADVLTIHGGGLDVLAAVIRATTSIIPDLEVRYEDSHVVLYTPEVSCEATAPAAAPRSTTSTRSTPTRPALDRPSPSRAAPSGPPADTEPAPPSVSSQPDAPTCGEYHPMEEDIACDRVVGHSGPHSYLEANGHAIRWRTVSLAAS